jgi:anti-anti-sigma regulatory factor
MLRIGVHDDNKSTRFTIEGKLTGHGAAELERCWRTVMAAEPSKAIVVDLASVTFVDSECRQLLVRMRRQGVELVPTGCLMRAIVEQIEAEVASDACVGEHQPQSIDAGGSDNGTVFHE